MLTTTERVLTPAELLNLSTRLKASRLDSRSSLVTSVSGSALACVVLVLLTYASGTPIWIAILFWTSLVGLLTWWRQATKQRSMDERTALLDQAVRTNLARVTRVQSGRVIEFEKDDHEAACYAFEIDTDSSLFIVGHDFVEGEGFPNSDFSIVEIMAGRGQPMETTVEKHGTRLVPVAIVPNATKSLMVVPEHMSVLPLALDRITEGLPHRRR